MATDIPPSHSSLLRARAILFFLVGRCLLPLKGLCSTQHTDTEGRHKSNWGWVMKQEAILKEVSFVQGYRGDLGML